MSGHSRHSAVIHSNNRVSITGNNNSGQCGVPAEDVYLEQSHTPIVTFAYSPLTSLTIIEDRRRVLVNHETYLRVGKPSKDEDVPDNRLIIENVVNIEHVVGADDHSKSGIYVSTSGREWYFIRENAVASGFAEYIRYAEPVSRPKNAKGLGNEWMVEYSKSSDADIYVSDGEMYARGDNSHHGIGLPEEGRVYASYTKIDVPGLVLGFWYANKSTSTRRYEPCLFILYEHIDSKNNRTTKRIMSAGYDRYGALGGNLYDNNRELSDIYAYVSGWIMGQTKVYEFRDLGVSNIIQVSLGSYHTMLLDGNGRPYALGDNWNGQLGIGPSDDKYPKGVHDITRVPIQNKVKKIFTGNNNTVFLMQDNRVMGCGSNTFGALGQDISGNTFIPVYLKYNGKDIRDVRTVSVGYNTIYIVLNNGDMLRAGDSSRWQLGGNTTERETKAFFKLVGYPKVKDVSGGHYYSIFITEEGHAYGAGRFDSGELGMEYGSGDARYAKDYIQLYMEHTDSGKEFPTGNVSPITDADKVFCGQQASLIMLKNGTVIVTGQDARRTLGTGDFSTRNKWTKADIGPIKQVSMGYSHSYFILNNNSIAVSGSNSYGQMGTGEDAKWDDYRNTPISLPNVSLLWEWMKEGNVFVKTQSGWIKSEAVYVKTARGWAKSEENVRAKTQKGWR